MQVTIEDVQAQTGGTAQFQAVIEGSPQPTVTWYKVGTGGGWGPCARGGSVKPPRDTYSLKHWVGHGAWAPRLG